MNSKKSFRIGALYGINIANNNISNSNLRNGIYHKKIKSLVESGLLIKGASKRIKNKTKQLKGRFLGMLLGTLSANLLQHLLTRKVKE